ncbi:MAG TPA: pyrroloquinoline quinone-dependent dehydrogenase [Terriglobia bacterium]|nr:pyrroloquinoline quinone-dependent dehydrogenase [Terriglobia bacterium]
MRGRIVRMSAIAPVLVAAIACFLAWAEDSIPANTEWRYWGGDARTTHYAPLDQIGPANVSRLQIVWRWNTASLGGRADSNWEVTPLMVGGILYFTAGQQRHAVAANAATGETLWTYVLDEGARAARPVRSNNRGLAYWSDGRNDSRVLFITPGYQLVALEARTGKPIPTFGASGVVDLTVGLDRDVVRPSEIGATSPAMIVGDVAIVGAALLSGTTPRSMTNVPGYVRGYDVRTGERLWTFHTIPRPGEFGHETWEEGSWEYTGNTAVWAPMSADLELGYVYLPVESPTGDYYGGHRPGDNLFADTLVCLDAKTGRRVWHYQLLHHDIWDYDIASAPTLLDVTIDGKRVKAVAQPTKQAFLFAFDRVTGKPLWPIEERPVPQSDAPMEKTSPTQPFPTRPAPFDRQGVTLDDLMDLTPELKAEAARIASEFKLGPLFTPPIVEGAGGKRAALQVPHTQGGANWQGAGADPETGIVYVPSVTNWYGNALRRNTQRSDMAFVGRSVAPERPMGLPLIKGPWGRITAIDLNTGDHLWMVPNGKVPEYIRNHPALQGVDLSGLGNPERAPLLVTRTLLFAGDGSGMFSSGPNGGGPIFRALDKRTGALIHEMRLPGNETGLPMTYMLDGRQYIVVAVGNRNAAAELVALALPK